MLLSGLTSGLSAQDQRKHFVYFKDKANSPYSLAQPSAYLSEAALKRRENQRISLTTRDLPVNPAYVTQLKKAGVEVWYKSKWFNGAVISCDSTQLAQVMALPFVKNATVLEKKTQGNQPEKFNELPASNLRTAAQPADYGPSFRQADMLGVTRLHDEGYRGEGMTIAVFDAGFPGVNTAQPFAHLFQNNQVKGTFDFVRKNPDVYLDNSHGTNSLSCIGAYQPGKFIGTAYKADFYLFITEYAPSEHRIEEYNWLMAAEYADSAGVDVINSSLGYTTFDFPSASYTYQDLDGKTAVITRAADLAASTGMLVVNSAGNEGRPNNPWHYIGAPADGDSVLAVGAVNSDGFKADFSSFGPTADGRIKPNVSAQGVSTAVVSANGSIAQASGTSFASPVLAGMATAFWQAFPYLTNMEVIQYLQASATQANNPDNELGYGIPNYNRANTLVEQQFGTGKNIIAFPNPLNGDQALQFDFEDNGINGEVAVKIFDRLGRLVEEKTLYKRMRENLSFKFNSNLNAGMYILKVTYGNQVRTHRLIKLQ